MNRTAARNDSLAPATPAEVQEFIDAMPIVMLYRAVIAALGDRTTRQITPSSRNAAMASAR